MNDWLLLWPAGGAPEFQGAMTDGEENFLPGVFIDYCDNTFELRKDHYCQTPFFYGIFQGTLVAGPDWLKVCRLIYQASKRFPVNLAYVWKYLKYQTPLTRDTFVEGVYCLRNGESVSWAVDEKPLTRFTLRSISANRAGFDLMSSIDQQLQDLLVYRPVFHISSGLDSSILAISAARYKPGGSIDVATLRTLGRGLSDELETVNRLCDDFGLNLHVFDARQIDVFHEAQNIVSVAFPYPMAHPSHLARYILDSHLSSIAGTIVTGRGPDETLGGYEWHNSEYACPQKYWKRMTVTEDTMLESLFDKNTPFDSKLMDHEICSFHGKNGFLSLGTRLEYDRLTLFEMWNTIDHSLKNSLVIKYASPFLNGHQMNILAALPDNKKIQNGVQKWILKETFKDRYPRYLFNQPKRALSLDLAPYFRQSTENEVLSRIYDESPFCQKYVNRSTVLDMITSTLRSRRNFGWQLWNLHICSITYERYCM